MPLPRCEHSQLLPFLSYPSCTATLPVKGALAVQCGSHARNTAVSLTKEEAWKVRHWLLWFLLTSGDVLQTCTVQDEGHGTGSRDEAEAGSAMRRGSSLHHAHGAHKTSASRGP